ncbi:hypothetical protein [Nocardia sp. NPDC020380]|uniref:hypothetical protein n=1 Tax=Nocardia sp. NPDC020380 TaxID=3364309 RepID=UPI00378AB46F
MARDFEPPVRERDSAPPATRRGSRRDAAPEAPTSRTPDPDPVQPPASRVVRDEHRPRRGTLPDRRMLRRDPPIDYAADVEAQAQAARAEAATAPEAPNPGSPARPDIDPAVAELAAPAPTYDVPAAEGASPAPTYGAPGVEGASPASTYGAPAAEGTMPAAAYDTGAFATATQPAGADASSRYGTTGAHAIPALEPEPVIERRSPSRSGDTGSGEGATRGARQSGGEAQAPSLPDPGEARRPQRDTARPAEESAPHEWNEPTQPDDAVPPADSESARREAFIAERARKLSRRSTDPEPRRRPAARETTDEPSPAPRGARNRIVPDADPASAQRDPATPRSGRASTSAGATRSRATQPSADEPHIPSRPGAPAPRRTAAEMAEDARKRGAALDDSEAAVREAYIAERARKSARPRPESGVPHPDHAEPAEGAPTGRAARSTGEHTDPDTAMGVGEESSAEMPQREAYLAERARKSAAGVQPESDVHRAQSEQSPAIADPAAASSSARAGRSAGAPAADSADIASTFEVETTSRRGQSEPGAESFVEAAVAVGGRHPAGSGDEHAGPDAVAAAGVGVESSAETAQREVRPGRSAEVPEADSAAAANSGAVGSENAKQRPSAQGMLELEAGRGSATPAESVPGQALGVDAVAGYEVAGESVSSADALQAALTWDLGEQPDAAAPAGGAVRARRERPGGSEDRKQVRRAGPGGERPRGAERGEGELMDRERTRMAAEGGERGTAGRELARLGETGVPGGEAAPSEERRRGGRIAGVFGRGRRAAEAEADRENSGASGGLDGDRHGGRDAAGRKRRQAEAERGGARRAAEADVDHENHSARPELEAERRGGAAGRERHRAEVEGGRARRPAGGDPGRGQRRPAQPDPRLGSHGAEDVAREYRAAAGDLGEDYRGTGGDLARARREGAQDLARVRRGEGEGGRVRRSPDSEPERERRGAEGEPRRERRGADGDVARTRRTAEADLVRERRGAEGDPVRERRSAEMDLGRESRGPEADLGHDRRGADGDLPRGRRGAELDARRELPGADADLGQALLEGEVVRERREGERARRAPYQHVEGEDPRRERRAGGAAREGQRGKGSDGRVRGGDGGRLNAGVRGSAAGRSRRRAEGEPGERVRSRSVRGEREEVQARGGKRGGKRDKVADREASKKAAARRQAARKKQPGPKLLDDAARARFEVTAREGNGLRAAWATFRLHTDDLRRRNFAARAERMEYGSFDEFDRTTAQLTDRGYIGAGGGRMNVVGRPVEYRATTAQVAGLWPWSVGAGAPLIGTPLGSHLHTGAPVCFDPMNWFMRGSFITAPSLFVLGLNGFGKSSLVRRIVLGGVAQGITPLILADVKPDYRKLVELVGGQVIDLGYGHGKLNPLAAGVLGSIVPLLDDMPELQVQVVQELRARQVTLVAGLVELVRGARVRDFEETLIATGLRILYRDGSGFTPDHPPILEDLLTVVVAGGDELQLDAGADNSEEFQNAIKGLRRSLRALTQGPFGAVFNGHTTTPIDTAATAVCIDVSHIPQGDKKLKAAVMLACWADGFASVEAAHVLADANLGPQRYFQVVMDELWQVLGLGDFMVDRVDELTRLQRGIATSLIMISHTIKDLQSLGSEAAIAKALGFLERARAKIFGALPAEEIQRLDSTIPFTSAEEEMVTSWSAPQALTGEALKPGQQRPPAPGTGKFLLKIGEDRRPGIPFHMEFTPSEKESGIHDTNQRFSEFTETTARRGTDEGSAA